MDNPQSDRDTATGKGTPISEEYIRWPKPFHIVGMQELREVTVMILLQKLKRIWF
jgi:hypothetical protein